MSSSKAAGVEQERRFGLQYVGHEGLATRRRDISLRRFSWYDKKKKKRGECH